jgi:serine/threonine-protein kinase
MSHASRYTILRKITDGGTAEIFLAKQHGAQGFEKTVVLKRIFTTFYADPQFRHMLVDEAHIAMSLNHSGIVQVLDLGESEGRYFLALELVDGWSLDRILKRAKAAGVQMPPPIALYVTAEVCRALAYAHSKKRADGKPLGIVHRDVSPHNVLISEQGEVKLTDFGIAKSNKTEKSLGNLIKGKFAFMSPEQASAGELDGRSDLFSVGTSLYVMITRRHPFDAPTDYETLMLVKNGDFMPPETARPGLNPELYRVIRKAMSKLPDDRYQNAEDMLVDVEQVMRVAFRPVGQTELQRWLADLGAKDGVPPLTREAPAEPATSRSTVGPLLAGSGQESGLVLSLEDAVEVRSADRPPPTPVGRPIPLLERPAGDRAPPAVGPTEVMTRPPTFASADLSWHQRTGVRVAIGAAVLLLGAGVAAKLMHAGGSTQAPPAAPPAQATAAPPPTAPAAPPAAPAAPPPAAQPGAGTVTDSGAAVTHADEGARPSRPAEPAAAAEPEKTPSPEPPAETDDQEATGPAHEHGKGRLGQFPVLVKTDPEGSRVATGRHVFGTTPITLKLRPGNSYDLTFTRAGYAPLSRRYHFDANAPQTLHVTLKKLPEPHKVATTPAPKPAPPPPPPPPKGFFSR